MSKGLPRRVRDGLGLPGRRLGWGGLRGAGVDGRGRPAEFCSSACIYQHRRSGGSVGGGERKIFYGIDLYDDPRPRTRRHPSLFHFGIRFVERAGAALYAATELNNAKEKLRLTRRWIEAGDYAPARWLAEQAQIDAELAEVKARVGNSRR